MNYTKFLKLCIPAVLVLLARLFLSFSASAQSSGECLRVACVGNSITYGACIDNRDRDSYPAVLSQMLGKGYEVRNYGVSAHTLLRKGDHPYVTSRQYKAALQFNPDIVVIKLGTNDSKPQNWQYADDFESDYGSLIESFRALPANPRIILCLPTASFNPKHDIRDSVVLYGVIPRIIRTAEKYGLEILDCHSLTANMPERFPDGIHPDREGAAILAAAVYGQITGKKLTLNQDFHLQPFPGIRSKWRGFDKYEFSFEGRTAIVVSPVSPLPGRPWIWRPAFFGAFPAVDVAMLALGYHVVYYDVTHLYGSPRSQDMGDRFYAYMRKYYDFSEKVIMEGFSRGGLFAVNWAARNPDKVSCIYLDAPVCDIYSWPGKERAELFDAFVAEWGLSAQEADNFRDNPLDHLKPLAKAHVPIVAVAGDSDATVPYEDNLKKLAERYRKLGGKIDVILKEGCDHHPHSLDAPAPIVRLILDAVL